MSPNRPSPLVLILSMSLAAACGPFGPAGRSDPVADPVPGEAIVVRVVDGDTIVARLGPEEETVRLLGIDSPETKKPGSPVECYGTEAATHLHGLLPEGTIIRLERDATERDRYGRLLAYVHRQPDEIFINHELVAGGFADLYRVAPNGARHGELAEAASAARRAGRGLWARCGGSHQPLPP
jgi:micrococcal nuclease